MKNDTDDEEEEDAVVCCLLDIETFNDDNSNTFDHCDNERDLLR